MPLRSYAGGGRFDVGDSARHPLWPTRELISIGDHALRGGPARTIVVDVAQGARYSPGDTMLTDDYTLHHALPDVDSYVRLRLEAGLTPRTREQAAAGLPGSWCAVHVRHKGGATVGMGRVIGDGGWYFHIVDMAVLPDHQRRGLGDAILQALLERIRAAAAPGAYVSLLADPPGRRLYARHGFTETAPASIGMARKL